MVDNTENKTQQKRILERPFYSGLVVPTAIILVGALIVFGVMKLLSNERSHRDLINELHSKTFGNRWVAAYELSKVLSTTKFEPSERAWLVKELDTIYRETIDARTRNFIILALKSLNTDEALKTFEAALSDQDGKVKFNAVVAIGNLPKDTVFDFEKLRPLANAKDQGVKQAVLLAVAQHKVLSMKELLSRALSDSNRSLRYAAALGLINFQDKAAMGVLKEILNLPTDVKADNAFSSQQILNLKLNILISIAREKWFAVSQELVAPATNDANLKVSTKAREVLNILKN